MIKPVALALLLAFALPTAGLCEDKIPWGDSAGTKKLRTQVDGMKTFYDPEAVKKDGGAVYFKMYSAADPAAKDEGVDYAINCKTQEVAMKAGEWKKPERVLPGEQLYPIAKKLCEWGPGFFERAKKGLFD